MSSSPAHSELVELGCPPRESGDGPCVVTQRIRTALDSKGYSALRCVDVALDGSAVRLQGSVATYFLKQVAHTTVLGIVPHLELQDGIRVESPSW